MIPYFWMVGIILISLTMAVLVTIGYSKFILWIGRLLKKRLTRRLIFPKNGDYTRDGRREKGKQTYQEINTTDCVQEMHSSHNDRKTGLIYRVVNPINRKRDIPKYEQQQNGDASAKNNTGNLEGFSHTTHASNLAEGNTHVNQKRILPSEDTCRSSEKELFSCEIP
jgi:hypothetical protein